MKRARLLVVDDDSAVVDWLVEALTDEGYAVVGVTSPETAIEHAKENPPDLVVADVEMPGMRGLELMSQLQRENPRLLVLLITAFGSIELAMQAMHAGACDFVTKPFRIESLVQAIERSLRERRMRREIVRLRTMATSRIPAGIVANSAAMKRVMDLANRTANNESTSLLTGESEVEALTTTSLGG